MSAIKSVLKLIFLLVIILIFYVFYFVSIENKTEAELRLNMIEHNGELKFIITLSNTSWHPIRVNVAEGLYPGVFQLNLINGAKYEGFDKLQFALLTSSFPASQTSWLAPGSHIEWEVKSSEFIVPDQRFPENSDDIKINAELPQLVFIPLVGSYDEGSDKMISNSIKVKIRNKKVELEHPQP